MKRALLFLVAFYRRWLSPLKGRPTCRFLPTCSEYAAEAVTRHGALRGSAKALWRLCRCHPFCRGGYDPVQLREGARDCMSDERRTGLASPWSEQQASDPASPAGARSDI